MNPVSYECNDLIIVVALCVILCSVFCVVCCRVNY